MLFGVWDRAMKWIKNPRQNPPPENLLVRIRSDDFMGVWFGQGKKLSYKISPTGQLKGFKKGWRWVDENNVRLDDQGIEAWALIEEE